MNLRFINVGEKTQGGVEYLLQRAIITTDKTFWWNWRNCKDELKKYIYIRKEPNGGKNEWFAYRLFPKNKTGGYGTFPVRYHIRNSSGLLEYQPEVVASACGGIIDHGAFADGSDTGLGKTYTSLAACRELAVQPAIICKKAGIAGWKAGCRHFGIPPLFIVNWERAKSESFKYTTRYQDEYDGRYRYQWKLPAQSLLIFDEVHLANHEGSQNSEMYMASRGIASISVSATFADKPERLKPLFHVLGISHRDKFDDLLSKACQRFTNDRDTEESISNLSDMHQLNRMLYPKHAVRVTYNDSRVKEYFPEVVYQTQVVTLSVKDTQRQNKSYKEMLEKVASYQKMGKQSQVLVARLRYRQMAELLKADIIVDMVKNYIYAGKAVVVFVNFRETLAYLAKAFNTKSLIFGGQDSMKINREKVIDDFTKDKTRFIFAMVDAGGSSINLHDVTGNHPRVSIVCPNDNPVTLKQVLGRTFRANAKTKVLIKLVYAEGTKEEAVAANVGLKLDNIHALNDGDLMEEDLLNMGIAS